MYYILPTVLWIFIGASESAQNPEMDIKKTIFLYGTFITLKNFLFFIGKSSLDFNNLRLVFGLNVYDLGFILPISAICVFLHKEVYVGEKIDRMIVVLMTLNVVLSLGRIAILQPMIIFTVLLFMEGREAENQTKIKKVVKLFFSITVALVVVFYIMPDSIKSPLMDKVLNSFDEVDSSQKITSVGSAMNNWRAYEIQSAKEQWKGEWVISQLFGEGMGKGVEIQYVPYSWAGVVDGNEIPLLHNGFYTMLIKGGIIGVAALLWLFMGNAKKGLYMVKHRADKVYSNILVAISVAAVANTYVVRGPIQQGAFLTWALLIGWINRKEKNNGRVFQGKV
ncbi:MAG: O-antigen ligase family protein [Clostridiales bacterium]|nr:O-antigen ligase family protein [Clostridiales bacterium]